MSAPKIKVVTALESHTFEERTNSALEALDKAGHGIMQITYGFEAHEESHAFAAIITYREFPYDREAVNLDAT